MQRNLPVEDEGQCLASNAGNPAPLVCYRLQMQVHRNTCSEADMFSHLRAYGDPGTGRACRSQTIIWILIPSNSMHLAKTVRVSW